MESKNIKILDKYILRQVIEIFILGVIVFSSLVFASNVFTALLKQISDYGLQPKYAFMVIILNLPTVFVRTIPMSMLLATIMGINKLCLSSELAVMRACGIGINRIAKPILIFAALMTILTFGINEYITPYMGHQSKTLLIWALGQKNIPDGKKNFTLKETKDDIIIKRFFYVQNCTKKRLDNVSVIDFSDDKQIQIVQATKGETTPDGWIFKNASVYTINDNGKLMNTSWLNKTKVDYGIEARNMTVSENEMNIKELAQYIKTHKFEDESLKNYLKIQMHNKIALPITTIIMALIGIPLAITPPRARFNRGFLLSIIIILIFYVISAFASALGESGKLPAIIAAWIPNIIFLIFGYIAYYRKTYKIN